MTNAVLVVVFLIGVIWFYSQAVKESRRFRVRKRCEELSREADEAVRLYMDAQCAGLNSPQQVKWEKFRAEGLKKRGFYDKNI